MIAEMPLFAPTSSHEMSVLHVRAGPSSHLVMVERLFHVYRRGLRHRSPAIYFPALSRGIVQTSPAASSGWYWFNRLFRRPNC